MSPGRGPSRRIETISLPPFRLLASLRPEGFQPLSHGSEVFVARPLGAALPFPREPTASVRGAQVWFSDTASCQLTSEFLAACSPDPSAHASGKQLFKHANVSFPTAGQAAAWPNSMK